MALKRAVFVDRDGVINPLWVDPEHGVIDSPANPDQFDLLEGVPEALRLLRSVGFLVVVVSNQPGIAKGKLTRLLLDAITEKMENGLRAGGVTMDGVYYCLHHPQAALEEFKVACECRKPKPGLLLRAAREMGIDLSGSYMIGDGLNDIQAGSAAGCRTIWIGPTGKLEYFSVMHSRQVRPDLVATDLLVAAGLIQKMERGDGNLP